VQLVSATNVKLDAAVASGRFRADLLYRMNALEVTLPSLATRSDIEAVAQHVLKVIAPGCRLEDGALAHVRSHPWPGNIRQLRNELARASLRAVDGVIDTSMIEAACTHQKCPEPAVSPAQQPAPALTGDASMRSAHKDVVLAALAETGGNISLAARHLRVSRNTIYRALGRTTPAGSK
jgi:transcriptional regulator of acetoin/glycerol metabolism